MSHSDELTRNLGFCPQENILFPDLCVAQQLCFFNMLKNRSKPKTLIDVEVRSVLEKLNLSKKKNTFPNQLTISEKRRVCLGIALIGNPKILILDEPTLGLDAEEKHRIWKLLLRMNGQNTILIGTRDTEEADVLGDAVAMLHEGELKCYGSPNYLKKLLGYENLQVTLDTETQSELEKICDYFDTESEVIGINHEKIILSVPDNEELPDSLDKIENHKEELGVTGINVSSFTLEKVYLEATYDNSAPLASREPSCSTVDKLDNEKQSRNVVKSLVCKKATYTVNNISTIAIILTMFFVSLLCASLVLISESEKRKIEIPIEIDMYNSITASYFYDIRAGLNPTDPAIVLGNNYMSVIEERRGRIIFNPYIVNLQVDKFNYAYRNLVGAEFKTDEYGQNDITATALYNPIRAKYALPIAINLVSNAVLRTILRSRDCSIEVSYEELAQFRDDVVVTNLTTNSRFDGFVVAVMLVFFVFPAVAFLVVHPLRESLSNVKHLQRIAGVSAGAYWGVMIIFDCVVLLVTSALFVIAFVIADLIFGLDLFGWQETLILLLLFILFANNALPLIYTFSFRKKSPSATIVLLSLLPICLVLVELTICIGKLYLCEDNHFFNTFRQIQKGFFLIIPYVSFFHGLHSFFNDVQINSDCRKLTNLASERVCELTPCCRMRCIDGSCSNAVSYFKNFENDVALEMSVLALSLTPLLYFTILFILECKLVPKLLSKMKAGMPDDSDVAFEEQVKKVKREIAFETSKIREKISSKERTNGDLNTVENGTETVFLDGREKKDYDFVAYELRKLYGNLVAIEDVSFGVQRNECFGLTGPSGAGKTTILKLITGKEIPDHGVINLRGERQHEGMGYCPQNEALIKTLNAYDHLYLFARLRGVADRKIDREVAKWIDRLNLNDCASQPTETYGSGSKRRLNIALALIGHPKLVLLDEPTKNLDPATRQSLWKIIQSCQIGQATILASDSIEECLTLCKSHAFVADGRFTDIGLTEELKQRLRTGFEIRFNLKYETTNDEINCLKKEMSKVFSSGILNEIPRFLKLHISPTETTWRKMYDLLVEIKDKFSCIDEFYVLTSVPEQLLPLGVQTMHGEANKNSSDAKATMIE
ncbi:retinal-specific phospholipid-transporting ATPase ABCA4-like [Phymastichus coffea]|uniref:retinal-specific phospholipid-transporting ATPase ABCA4-like n=1 Tax=Phymastichus coffea TaxID=108790 RepID=UPI00273C309C|nr:retinal-specific phospholipid-transporting ATPase ABCA4-like [Phymastichus coffea]